MALLQTALDWAFKGASFAGIVRVGRDAFVSLWGSRAKKNEAADQQVQAWALAMQRAIRLVGEWRSAVFLERITEKLGTDENFDGEALKRAEPTMRAVETALEQSILLALSGAPKRIKSGSIEITDGLRSIAPHPGNLLMTPESNADTLRQVRELEHDLFALIASLPQRDRLAPKRVENERQSQTVLSPSEQPELSDTHGEHQENVHDKASK
jgi:hypothetical protein